MSRGSDARGRRVARRAEARKQAGEEMARVQAETAATDEFFNSLKAEFAKPITDPDVAVATTGEAQQLALDTADETDTVLEWATIARLADDDTEAEDPPAEEASPMSGQCAECGHMANAHNGDLNDGACSMDDGCAAFEPSSEQSAAAGQVAVLAAAGDLAWGPEQGFMDLLNDVCGQLGNDWWAQDCTTDLTKVLLCSYGSDLGGSAYYVAPISIDGEGEPVLSTRNEWVEVEAAWVESADYGGARWMGLQGRVTPEGTANEAKATLTMQLQTMTWSTSSGGNVTTTWNQSANGGSWLPVFELTPEMIREPAGDGAVVLPSGTIQWTAVLAPEGQATDDGRIFAPGSIEWRELPLSLMGMVKTADGHDGAEVCGRIDTVWRDAASGLIMGQGEFDTGDFGSEIARLVSDGTLRGVSVDIAVSEMEIAYRGDVVDDDGRWKAAADAAEAADEAADAEDAEEDAAPSILDVLFGEGEDTIFVVRKGIIGAATVCPFPAFAEAKIEVGASLTAGGAPNVWTVQAQGGWRLRAVTAAAEGQADPEDAAEAQGAAQGALTASAAGLVAEAPAAEWFDDPLFEELTPLTVTDDGRVFGHAAPWDQCHIGLPGGCTTAPESETNYAYFLLKEVVCDDGERVPVGTITLDTGHAAQSLGRAQAASHYDDTGTAVADVNIGQDDYGIWVAGALRADVDADAARKLRGAALSGDWRDVNGNLELVALLAVNVPGFPVPRPTAALVASGDGFEVATLQGNAPVTAETIDALAARHRADAEASVGFAEIVEALAEPLDKLTEVLDEPVVAAEVEEEA